MAVETLMAPHPGGEGLVLRRNFSSSRLVRVLGRWDPAGTGPPHQDVVEHMSQWLSVRDAIVLDGAHRTIQGLALACPTAPSPVPTAAMVAHEVRRMRAALVQQIQAGLAPAPVARRGRYPLPVPDTAAPEPDAGSAFAPLHKHYLDLQRRMELRIDALRADVRKRLAASSRELAQLAALDAVLAPMLAERARRAFANLPTLLERRCAQLRGGGAADLPAWSREMQDLLLAELEARLEPVVGLVEAARHSGGGGSASP